MGFRLLQPHASGGCLAQERDLLRRRWQFRACPKSSGKFWNWKFRSQNFYRNCLGRSARANILENNGGSLVETLAKSQALELGNAPAFVPLFSPELRQLLSGDVAGQERTNGETRVK
jgi:hypothetical protein